MCATRHDTLSSHREPSTQLSIETQHGVAGKESQTTSSVNGAAHTESFQHHPPLPNSTTGSLHSSIHTSNALDLPMTLALARDIPLPPSTESLSTRALIQGNETAYNNNVLAFDFGPAQPYDKSLAQEEGARRLLELCGEVRRRRIITKSKHNVAAEYREVQEKARRLWDELSDMAASIQGGPLPSNIDHMTRSFQAVLERGQVMVEAFEADQEKIDDLEWDMCELGEDLEQDKYDFQGLLLQDHQEDRGHVPSIQELSRVHTSQGSIQDFDDIADVIDIDQGAPGYISTGDNQADSYREFVLQRYDQASGSSNGQSVSMSPHQQPSGPPYPGVDKLVGTQFAAEYLHGREAVRKGNQELLPPGPSVRSAINPAELRWIAEWLDSVQGWRRPIQKTTVDQFSALAANLNFVRAWFVHKLESVLRGHSIDEQIAREARDGEGKLLDLTHFLEQLFQGLLPDANTPVPDDMFVLVEMPDAKPRRYADEKARPPSPDMQSLGSSLESEERLVSAPVAADVGPDDHGLELTSENRRTPSVPRSLSEESDLPAESSVRASPSQCLSSSRQHGRLGVIDDCSREHASQTPDTELRHSRSEDYDVQQARPLLRGRAGPHTIPGATSHPTLCIDGRRHSVASTTAPFLNAMLHLDAPATEERSLRRRSQSCAVPQQACTETQVPVDADADS